MDAPVCCPIAFAFLGKKVDVLSWVKTEMQTKAPGEPSSCLHGLCFCYGGW